jgi:hypothetical protein
MDVLKKVFPLAFKKRECVSSLVIGIIVQILVIAVAGLAIWLATALVGWIPVVGALVAWVLGIVSSLLGLYCLVSIILSVLDYAKVFKD